MCNTVDVPEESEDKSSVSESEYSEAEEGNEQNRVPPDLEPYLAQLNHLTQTDLNFQNLLLMYLITLLPGFGGDGQAANLRSQTSNQIRDMLVEMISNAGKTQTNDEETGYSVPAQPTYDMEALGAFPSPMMVMGYPASNLQYRSPAMGMYNSSMGDWGLGNYNTQPMYHYHGGWMSSHQNEWNRGEQTIAGFMHSGALQVQGGSNTMEMKDEDVYVNARQTAPINYESDLMNNSDSSPASINDNTLEGESFVESSDTSSDFL